MNGKVPVMSDDLDLDSKKEKISDFVDRIGDSVDQEVDSDKLPPNLNGLLVCHHGSHVYHVYFPDEGEHAIIRYPFNIDEALAAQSVAQSGANPEDLSISQDMIQDARRGLDNRLDNVDSDRLRDLRINLIEALSKEGCSAQLDTTQSIFIHGFNVDKKFFLTDDTLTISDFEFAVQNVINLGWTGKSILIDAYNLTEEAVEQDRVSGDSAPGFQ